MSHQDIWELTGILFHRQRRRAELITRIIKRKKPFMLLDVGCNEGYITSFLVRGAENIIGIDVNLQALLQAKDKVLGAEFINASADYLPFRTDGFDVVCVFEVFEHLSSEILDKAVYEIDRILCPNGLAVVSVPYRENIQQIRCLRCGQETPLWGHLNRFDDNRLNFLFPKNYVIKKKYYLPNLQIFSCQGIFESFPFTAWMLINNILGYISKGYWIVINFSKN